MYHSFVFYLKVVQHYIDLKIARQSKYTNHGSFTTHNHFTSTGMKFYIVFKWKVAFIITCRPCLIRLDPDLSFKFVSWKHVVVNKLWNGIALLCKQALNGDFFGQDTRSNNFIKAYVIKISNVPVFAFHGFLWQNHCLGIDKEIA